MCYFVVAVEAFISRPHNQNNLHKLSENRTDTLPLHLSHKIQISLTILDENMEHIVSTLGVDMILGPSSARKAVMKRARPERSPLPSHGSISHHRDSLLLLKNIKSHKHQNDDDTMSTISATSSDSSLATVTFVQPLVTAVHYRPHTTLEEKAKLYYQDAEYRQFRHEYIYGRRQRKRVNFSSSLVSDVWAYEAQGDKASLYYAQSDLQRYVVFCVGRVIWTVSMISILAHLVLLFLLADFWMTLSSP